MLKTKDVLAQKRIERQLQRWDKDAQEGQDRDAQRDERTGSWE